MDQEWSRSSACTHQHVTHMRIQTYHPNLSKICLVIVSLSFDRSFFDVENEHLVKKWFSSKLANFCAALIGPKNHQDDGDAQVCLERRPCPPRRRPRPMLRRRWTKSNTQPDGFRLKAYIELMLIRWPSWAVDRKKGKPVEKVEKESYFLLTCMWLRMTSGNVKPQNGWWSYNWFN